MLFRKEQDKTAVLESCGGCYELVLAVQGPLEWSGMGVWRWEGAPQKGELMSKDISEQMNPTLNTERICNKFSQWDKGSGRSIQGKRSVQSCGSTEHIPHCVNFS